MNLRGTMSPHSFSATALPSTEAAEERDIPTDAPQAFATPMVDHRLGLLEAGNDENFKYVYDLQLRIHTLENKMSLILGEQFPNQQALRRKRYAMSQASSSMAESPEKQTSMFDIGSPQAGDSVSHFQQLKSH